MKKIIMASFCLLLTACSVQKEMVPVGGSKADGIIKMGYTVEGSETVVVDLEPAKEVAAKRCNLWGYAGAEPFELVTTTCTQVGYFGSCKLAQASLDFQCVDANAVKVKASK